MEKLIELNELRIGNLLNYKGKLSYVSHLSLDIDDEYTDLIGITEFGKTSNEVLDWNRALFNDLERVPLTPEILVKCGFKEIETVNSDGDDRSHYRHNWLPGYFFLDTMEFDNDDFVPKYQIKYLHQLQNLYFALNGEELVFKP